MKRRTIFGLIIVFIGVGVITVLFYFLIFPKGREYKKQNKRIQLTFLTSKRETRDIFKKIVDDFNNLQNGKTIK